MSQRGAEMVVSSSMVWKNARGRPVAGRVDMDQLKFVPSRQLMGARGR